MLNKLRNRKKKGFTLIELIVVLVIMVILAAAAIPTIMGYVENSRKAAYLSNMRAVYTAAQSALTEAAANGVTVTEYTTVIDGKTSGTTFIQRVADLSNMGSNKFTTNTTTAPAAKDQYQIVLSSTGTITKIVACYQVGANNTPKTVELIPGQGSDVMDTTSTSQA